MPVHPPSQRIVAPRPLRPSRFVEKCLRELVLPAKAVVLDLPTGTGRHSELLARLGYRVTLADIDPIVLRQTQERLQSLGLTCTALQVDAAAELPFETNSFDLVVVTDFVDENLLRRVGSLIRMGGYLIYESYAPRKGNWLQLLPPDRTEQLLAFSLRIDKVERALTGPSGSEAESIKLVARRVSEEVRTLMC